MNHQATQGAEAFNKAAGFMESIPFLLAVEFLLIYIPILYHGLYGIHIAFTAKENIGHYSLFRNWMFALQKIFRYCDIRIYLHAFMANYNSKILLW